MRRSGMLSILSWESDNMISPFESCRWGLPSLAGLGLQRETGLQLQVANCESIGTHTFVLL
jgi:hypothetical protein